jgi:Kdo2-lipid IVA lauroyltransferase/acyltransferase
LAKQTNPARQYFEYLATRTLFALLRFLPRSLAEPTARLLAAGLDFALPKLRRVARINLAFAMPELGADSRERVIDGVFRSIARILVSVAKFPGIRRGGVNRWIRYEGLEHYLRAKEKGRGILVATAHLGNWELSAFTHALMTEPMGVLVRPLDNPKIDSWLEKRRALSGNTVIVKRDAARLVLRALRDNRAVGMLIDQNTLASEGVFVNFFGKPACAASGFVRLAAHSGAAVIPGFAFWNERERGYVLRFYPEIPMSGVEQADAQAIHSFLETVIREYPDQWLWIHRRWKTQPAGAKAVY